MSTNDIPMLQRLSYQFGSEYRDQKLSTAQRDLIYKIHHSLQPFTSEQMASGYKISIQAASTRLNQLYHRGFITRDEVQQSSGGVIYVYRVADHLVKSN